MNLQYAIVAKALDGQRYPCPAQVGCAWSWRGSRAAAPKGSMTYAFTHMGNFLHLSLEARIWAFWIGFGLRDWDLGLGTRIWASKLGGGADGGGGENFLYVWKHRSSTPSGLLPCFPFNFKHNLLGQGTGTADHLTLLRLLRNDLIVILSKRGWDN